VKFPPTKSEFYAMKGGLDLRTPSIAMSPGTCFDCQNYEPEISGGYRRIDGYERYDGRPSPSAASYWIMVANITGSIAVGNTVTGATSAATGKVLGIFGSTLVLGRVTGTFALNESLLVSAAPQGTVTQTAYQAGAPSPSDDADYQLLAANDLRADIGKVPGSGPIRGLYVYQDVLYAFRDNANATAGLMYKATTGGWVQVTFGTELQFTNGTAAIAIGDTITGATSGATASVVNVLIRTGSWGSAAAGTLIITPISGSFVNSETIKVGGSNKATSASASTAISRLPGGRLEIINANFTGSTQTQKMYGTDGVNPCFEFDGTNYTHIRTGMASDSPLHLAFFKHCLCLSFNASFQISAIGNPYAWTAVLGAAEITTGEKITGLQIQGGTAAGGALTVFTAGQTYTLYGNSTADFKLSPSIWELGYADYTMQQVSNNTFGLTSRGIHSLITTLAYGDFDYASVSHAVQPYIAARRGMQTASIANKNRDQYRVFFNDGTALVLGLTGDKINGLMPLNYGKVVRVIANSTLTNGTEVTFFGSDDGYVYQDYSGTSFDGNPIEAWIRPAFNHSKSPLVRKTYRRAIFEVKPEGFSSVTIGYDLGYATPNVLSPVQSLSNQILGGGFWDQFYWDNFTWDAPVVSSVNMTLDGTEKNISFLFYSNRAQDKSHTVQGVTLLYTPRRLDRA
jgi:hypothetical protein